MCETCKNKVIFADLTYCKLMCREPTYDEYKKCKDYVTDEFDYLEDMEW